MKLYTVTVTLQAEPWLVTEFKSVLSKLPEFDEIAAEKAIVLAHNIASAKSQVRRVKGCSSAKLVDGSAIRVLCFATQHRTTCAGISFPQRHRLLDRVARRVRL
jgi:hypothetical protein